MKRVLAFLLLIALGAFALMLATAEPDATTKPTTQTAPREPQPTQKPAVARDAVRIDQEGTQVGLSGGFTVNRHRDVPRQGGGVIRQKIYELNCKDSAPAADGRHRLIDLRVQLFDQGKHVADLTASRALVELEANDQRQRELRENREIELEEARLTSIPGGSLPPVRLELGLVRALVGDEAITLHTPDENQPVTVVVDGERSGELRGRGLRARVPRNNDAGDAAMQLTILKEPEVVMQGLSLRAKGSLVYEERLRNGAASITLSDDVSADLRQGSRAGSQIGGSLLVTGRRLSGLLQRSRREKGSSGSSLAWTSLRLFGEPARVTTEGVQLDSPRITVLPGPAGQLATLTADGGQSALTQRDGGASFRSQHPIHLHLASAAVAGAHRAFGFGPIALGALSRMEIVVFEGPAEVDAKDGVSLRTDTGMHVFRPQDPSDPDALASRAFGNVRIVYGEGKDLVEATGDSGFFLARTQHGDNLRIGADDPAAAQRFDVRRGELRLTGDGAARIAMKKDGTAIAALRSDKGTLTASNAGEGNDKFGQLRNAKSIDATLRNGEMLAFVAEGPATELETARGGNPLFAKAQRMEQMSTTHWRLTGPRGTPATLRYDGVTDGADGTMSAPCIDVHRTTERTAMLVATEAFGERARIDAAAPMRKGGPKGRVTAVASRIRAMPFAVGAESELRRLFPLPAGAFEAVTAPMREPWIHAETNVSADLEEEGKGRMHMEAASLLARPGTRSLQIEGDVKDSSLATLVRYEGEAPTLIAKGARIRFAEADGERISMLTTYSHDDRVVPPSLQFRSDSGSLGWLQGECNGEIEALRESVKFFGPVHAHSLLDDQTPDPNGMNVDAAQLSMRRHKDTGELLSVDAAGGVTVRWRDLYAKSEKVELDLRWQRCIAEDAKGAEVRFGDGQSYVAERIEANYATYTVRSYFGRLQQDKKANVK